MIVNERFPERPLEIDLRGPHGNVFYLMSTAKKLAPKIGLDPDKIIAEMKEGDYEHVIKVFDINFGDYVTLYR